MPSRINVTKRQLLAIEAMALSKTNIKLFIVGKADNNFERDRMLDFINDHKLKGKVKYFDYVTQEEKLKLYSNAKAVLFIPFDEDYGYITLEAMSSSKAVITCSDSGGPLEFVVNGKNGIIISPNALEIAKAIDTIAGNSQMAKTFGANAKKHIDEMDISWDNVVNQLIQ
jgi:glycosyltransferase involved in cell wall biosynthesis